MTTLLTRILRDRCARCQVGQGKHCQCSKPRRFEISSAQFWWTTIVALTGFWAVVVWRVWEAFK